MPFSPETTRRFPRHRVDVPVHIVTLNGILTTPVPGRAGEISRGGMALRARVGLKPGDSLQLQFPTASPMRVTAVVRNRSGDCLGLEFLSQLPPDDRALDHSPMRPKVDFNRSAELWKSVHERLRRKQDELNQVKREIEALHMAILLLADDEEELSDSIGRIVRYRTVEVSQRAFDGLRKPSGRQLLPNPQRSRLNS